MLPHLGAGAGQAIEDALLLTQLLTHPFTNMSNAEARLHHLHSIALGLTCMLSDRAASL